MGDQVGTIGSTTDPRGGAGAHAAKPTHGTSFGDILSCLNPLQYLPVVGTIYRAITGDEIPNAVREAGSLVVSGLTGGPIGVGISLAVDAGERALGFDQEKFGRHLLAMIGIGHDAPAAGNAGAGNAGAGNAGAGNAGGTGADPVAFASAGGSTDADTLNGMELMRLASAAYGHAASLVA